MQDFSFAVKEKVVEDHNVIDEAIREEAEVIIFVWEFPDQLLMILGLYCFLHPRRRCLQTKSGQGQELKDERLLGQSSIGGCL